MSADQVAISGVYREGPQQQKATEPLGRQPNRSEKLLIGSFLEICMRSCIVSLKSCSHTEARLRMDTLRPFDSLLGRPPGQPLMGMAAAQAEEGLCRLHGSLTSFSLHHPAERAFRGPEDYTRSEALVARCTQLVPALVGAAILLLAPGASPAAGQTAQESAPAPPAEQEQPDYLDYSDQVVWNSHAPTRALFLPQSVLDTTPLKELPLLPRYIQSVEGSVNLSEADRRRSRPDPCSVAYEDPVVLRTIDSPPTIPEWIASQYLAFLGTVIDTVPGLGTWGKPRPVTLVYVQVEEILRDGDDSLQLSQVLAYFQEDARIELNGKKHCSKLPRGADLAEVGERVLFTGARYGGHEFFLSAGYVFPVREEKVLPLSWTPHFRNAEPASLATVQSAIHGEGGQ